MKKRRIRLKLKFWLILAALVLGGISLSGNFKNEVKTEKMSYVVQAGDTLWDIAEEYAPNSMDMREYIRNVKEHNELETLNIYPDMVLEIEGEAE